MHVHMNHMWCNESNWGGTFDSRYLVKISEHLRLQDTEPDKDWVALTEEFEYFDEDKFKRMMGNPNRKMSEEDIRDWCMKTSSRLKPEVLKWLHDNVADNAQNKEQPKGWAIYGKPNEMRDSVDIFFYRRSDTMKFIKTWSLYKKPTTYFNYFKDVRKELNPDTNTLQTVTRFTRYD